MLEGEWVAFGKWRWGVNVNSHQNPSALRLLRQHCLVSMAGEETGICRLFEAMMPGKSRLRKQNKNSPNVAGVQAFVLSPDKSPGRLIRVGSCEWQHANEGSTTKMRGALRKCPRGSSAPLVQPRLLSYVDQDKPALGPAEMHTPVPLVGSIHRTHGIWGLLSSQLGNPAHEYSFQYSCFYICITKRINAQMPLSSSRPPREKVGRLRI